MSKLKWVAAGLIALALAGATPALAQNPCGINTGKVILQLQHPSSDLTLLAAHRGVHALYNEGAYRRTPENSLQSIENAGYECIEIIELDVRMTQDSVPILSHDSTWGRETNVGSGWAVPLYNPWSGVGPNPLISDWSLYSVQTASGGIKLRDSVDFSWSSWNESPPTLRQAIQYMKQRNNPAVLALDVKDRQALQNAWQVVAQETFQNRTFFKLDVNLFPNQKSVEDFFGGLHYVDGRTPDINWVYYMPVYNTSNIAPNNALGSVGGEGKIWDSAGSFTVSKSIVGLEFNIKQPNGIMTSPANHDWKTTRTIFNPRREYEDERGPLYFDSDGRCCSSLTRYLFDGRPYGLPSDTGDQRSDWGFVLDQNTFNLITTDNVLQIRNELNRRNRRNTDRIAN